MITFVDLFICDDFHCFKEEEIIGITQFQWLRQVFTIHALFVVFQLLSKTSRDPELASELVLRQ